MTKYKIKRRLLWLPLALLLLAGALLLPGQGLPRELWIWAKTHGVSPASYPQELVALYERNPDARDFVKHYPMLLHADAPIDLSGEVQPGELPLLIQWDTRWGAKRYNENFMALAGCGPTCMAMAAIYLTGDTSLDPWTMAQFAESHGYNEVGSGTKWSFFTEGAEALGLDSTEIPLDRQRVMDNLAVGNVIICVVGPGDFTTSGHYILLAGTENGQIRVHDPNSLTNSETLWDYETLAAQIQGLWVLRA